MQLTQTKHRYPKPPITLAALAALLMFALAACGPAGAATAGGGSAAAFTPPVVGGGPSTAPQLDRNTIPKFVNQLERLPTYIPVRVTKDASGRVTAQEFNVDIAKAFTQQLPPGFPQTLAFTYGSNTVDGFGRNPDFRRSSPGPTFEQVRNAAATIHYTNDLLGQHPLAVDPTLDWANPNNFPKPTPPFAPFPPGYPQAQSPIPHVTHTHGIEVLPEFDGTPDLWFTNDGRVGPEFVSTTYSQPSTNESAAFWYHDHSFGVTRLDVGMGLNGYSILRDPNNPLDVVGNSHTLGLEDSENWTESVSTIVPRVDTRHTEGSFSIGLKAKNFSVLRSATFPLTGPLASVLSVDVFVPAQSPTPSFPGAVQMYVDCPSKGVNNAFVGQVELAGKPLNTFSRLSFPVPAAIASSVGSSCPDFDVRLGVNVAFNATGTYLFDNILGIRKVTSTPLPTGEFEVPLIVGDRSYRTDGTIFYPIAQDQPPGTLGANPDVNPYWQLIVNGDTNIVNGKVWPNMNVKRHAYRFRVLVAANQRFYRFTMSNGMPFTLIGCDGGYLRTPMITNEILQGVTERSDFILDFSQFAPGTKIVMRNIEQLNPPVGAAPDPNNDGLVMQFTVQDTAPVPARPLPATLNNIATLTPDRPTRFLIQNVETDDAGRVLQAELDGQLFHELTTELPTIGSTDQWEFINLTPLTHNKHVHLIEFQLLSRQTFDTARYLADWLAINGNPPFAHPTLKLDPTRYLTGTPTGPRPEESGWKDTIRTDANMVTRIRIRWNPQSLPTGASTPGVNRFNFDPVDGVGYIWHCHLLEHEDNEMMRPMTVIPIWKPGVFYPVGFRGSPGVNRGLVDFNGVDYQARVAHTSVAGQTPNTRPDLWERINNQNGDWAIQIIYDVGDRVIFQGNVYRALVKHQAAAGLEPTNRPDLWSLVTAVPM